MTDPSKFADFSIKANENLDQIETSLLRHDRNPKDREFLNDISKSVNAIKSAAIPLGLSRTIELCHHLDSLLNLIRTENKDLHHEIILLLASCKDRFGKLIFELETQQTERAKVKDLVTRIQDEIESYTRETESAETDLPSNAQDPKPVTAGSADDLMLLPEEIRNETYDKELFQIYLGQLQENISLLRALTDKYETAANKQRVITQCSDLIDKLQSSANYMGYDKLAEFYLQWVAELEMAGVELSLGTIIPFDFMDRKIKKIAELCSTFVVPGIMFLIDTFL